MAKKCINNMRIMKKDLEAFREIAIFSRLDQDSLVKDFNIYPKRVKKLIGAGLLAEERAEINGRNIKTYVLTEESAAYVEQRFGISRYKGDPRQARHDWKLREYVKSLKLGENIKILSQTDIQRMFVNRIDFTQESCPDLAYLDESGQMRGVEVITKNYKTSDLEKKRNFESKFDIPIDYIKIR